MKITPFITPGVYAASTKVPDILDSVSTGRCNGQWDKVMFGVVSSLGTSHERFWCASNWDRPLPPSLWCESNGDPPPPPPLSNFPDAMKHDIRQYPMMISTDKLVRPLTATGSFISERLTMQIDKAQLIDSSYNENATVFFLVKTKRSMRVSS